MLHYSLNSLNVGSQQWVPANKTEGVIRVEAALQVENVYRERVISKSFVHCPCELKTQRICGHVEDQRFSKLPIVVANHSHRSSSGGSELVINDHRY